MPAQTPISIYEFDDFRPYLKYRFEQRKAHEPSYSHRAFAAEAGFSNPGFLNDVIKARRKLSAQAMEKMISALSLSAAEADFFRLLVQYVQCKKTERKAEIYRQIASRRARSSFSQLNPALTKYYQDFRYPLIRTALMSYDFRGDYEELGRFLHPPQPAAAVKKCVRDLCEWELVRQRSDGRYEVTGQFVEPSPTLKEQVRQINREWIVQAMEALMTLPPEKRHISSMLLSVSPSTAKKITEKIETFRQEIWDLVKNSPEEPSLLMQLNMQYFPRSRAREKT